MCLNTQNITTDLTQLYTIPPVLVATVLCENKVNKIHFSRFALQPPPQDCRRRGESERRLYEVPALSLSTVSATKEKQHAHPMCQSQTWDRASLLGHFDGFFCSSWKENKLYFVCVRSCPK